MRKTCKLKNILLLLLGSAILAFGLYHIHSVSDITEGGSLGLTLLLDHWFDISPSISGLILNLICYGIGWKTLGRRFILYSLISSLGFSAVYAVCEQFPPLGVGLAEHPLAAALLGAVFVGVGVGFCIRAGGAPTADDAIAMSLQKLLKLPKIETVYLVSDLTVLALSLSYIPFQRIVYSLMTVILSGKIIGWIQRIKKDISF